MDTKNWSLAAAIQWNQLDKAKALIEEGRDINYASVAGDTLLHFATYLSENTESLSFLIDEGLDVNVKNHKGETALHHAAQNGFLTCIQLLLENRADCQLKDNNERTPIMLAIENKRHESVALIESYLAAKNEVQTLSNLISQNSERQNLEF